MGILAEVAMSNVSKRPMLFSESLDQPWCHAYDDHQLSWFPFFQSGVQFDWMLRPFAYIRG